MGLQKQSLVEILRAALETWRRAGQMSRESVAIHVTEAHEATQADIATGITFDSTSKDAYTRAKSAAQKLYRWLGGDDEQEAKLPANMVLSILAALPMEQRLSVLNQILCPLGIEARSVDQGGAGRLDVGKLLRSVMKEGSDAQLALVNLSSAATESELLAAHKELVESAQVCERAAGELMTEITIRQARAVDN
ncbi:toxin YdaT family protein [Massilia sp. DD77]|uniref:toxin YdaT family protein n=1 Tax=Massilia sp. DD77 TaxID=3109349 RepID=UPI002FFDE744